MLGVCVWVLTCVLCCCVWLALALAMVLVVAIGTVFFAEASELERIRVDGIATLLYVNTGLGKDSLVGSMLGGAQALKIHDVVMGVQHSLQKYEGELQSVYNDDDDIGQ